MRQVGLPIADATRAPGISLPDKIIALADDVIEEARTQQTLRPLIFVFRRDPVLAKLGRKTRRESGIICVHLGSGLGKIDSHQFGQAPYLIFLIA